MDNQAYKLKILEERCTHARIEVGEALMADGLLLKEQLRGRVFDLVFLDAPCTGLGTLRRHPEIRWRLTPQAISEQAKLNLGLLKSAAHAVAAGGALLYATCTVTEEENRSVVEKFLASEIGQQFTVEPFSYTDVDTNTGTGIDTDTDTDTGTATDTDAVFYEPRLVSGGSDAHFCCVFRRAKSLS